MEETPTMSTNSPTPTESPTTPAKPSWLRTPQTLLAMENGSVRTAMALLANPNATLAHPFRFKLPTSEMFPESTT